MSKREVYGFEIPEGYDWVAVDGDGEVVAFKEKPYLEDESIVWKTYNTGMIYALGFPSGNQSVDFKNSLVYVPDLHPKQSNTEPQDLACFKQVADVIGEESAEIELEKVIKSGVDITTTSETIDNTFIFSETPQGSEFWWDISNGHLPEQYKQHVVTDTTTNTTSLEHLKEAMCEAVGNEQWDLGWDILKVIREHYGKGSV